MKNLIIGPHEKSDIDVQIDKILRGLGNPEPPIELASVRELLELDRQYYSTTNDSVLKEMVSRVRVGAKQVARRPTLLIDVIRKAKLSALWIPDHKRILIDRSLPRLKHRWAEAHEISHSVTEWHQPFLFGDSELELNPSCHEKLEAEANYGAGQLLFLRERFTREALDTATGMANIRNLANTYKNTITSTLWRYVEEAGRHLPMVGLVSPHPHHLPDDFDASNPCRYFIVSPKFEQMFSSVSEVDLFSLIQDYCGYRKTGPLGEDEALIDDDNGARHLFHFESFSNSYEVLTLGYYLHEHRVAVVRP